MNKQLLFLALVFLTPMNGYSQEKFHSALQDTINLDEVVVTGTAVKVNKNNVPMAVTVVRKRNIEESNESALLPILNGLVPGLFVTERGIMGFGVANNAAGQITIRGIGGSPTTGVLMLIDGHPQFSGLFGHPLPDSYVTSDVDRVEVIRGPASILYGSNAMGGVINIITKKQTKDGFNGNARLMYGSYNTMKYMASTGYKKNKFSAFASINHDQTDGHRPNSDFSITNGYLKMTYELNSNIQATTDFSLAQFKTTDPGPDTVNASPGSSLDISRGYWAFTLNNDYEKYSGTAKLFNNFGKHKVSDGFLSTDVNYGLNIYESIKLFKGSNITLGADYLTYGGKAENELAMNGQGILFKDTTLYDAGIYSFVQQSLFNKLTLNAGLRLQNHEVYGKEWIPSVGFAYKFTERTSAKGSISKGFRSPTIRELYMFNHNESLSPETIMSYETGGSQSFYNHRLNFELTGYIVKGDNLIIIIPMVGIQNAGEILNKGIEFAADARPTNKLLLNFTYSYINMLSPVYATPKHHLYLSGNYRMKKFHSLLSIQYVNHLDTDPTTDTNYQSYVLVNSRISYKICEFAELSISAENLLNQQYENNLYYPMPGITAFCGIKMKF